jgi:hypothetical protein
MYAVTRTQALVIWAQKLTAALPEPSQQMRPFRLIQTIDLAHNDPFFLLIAATKIDRGLWSGQDLISWGRFSVAEGSSGLDHTHRMRGFGEQPAAGAAVMRGLVACKAAISCLVLGHVTAEYRQQ